MDIVLFSVREDELNLLDEWKKDNDQHNLSYVYEDFTPENKEKIDGNEIVILSQVRPLEAELYEYLKEKNVKVIGTRSAGYDMYDLDLLKKNNIQLVNVPSYSPNAIGEFALVSALELTRKVPNVHKNVKEGDLRWTKPLLGREMRTLTVGIVGTGRIGMAAAKLFKGIGANILGFDIYPNDKNKEILEYTDLDTLIEKSDVISLHAPATKENYHLINKESFDKMKDTAVLVNVARGALVDTEALLEALDQKKIAGAAIDCYEYEDKFIRKEIEDIESIEDKTFKELLLRDDIIYTPHIAFYTETALKDLSTKAIDYAIEVINTGNAFGKVKF